MKFSPCNGFFAGCLLAFSLFHNPVAAQSATDSLTEEQIYYLADTAPASFMSLAKSNKVNPLQMRQFLDALSSQEINIFRFGEEWYQVYWNMLSDKERLDPVHIFYMDDNALATNTYFFNYKNPFIQYTFAHQAAFEEAWGKERLYPLQLKYLLAAVHNLPVTAETDPAKQFLARKKAAEDYYAELAKLAPVHLKTLEAFVNHQMVYTIDANPIEHRYWRNEYYQNYCTHRHHLFTTACSFMGDKITKEELQQGLNYLNKAIAIKERAAYNAVKIWFLHRLGQKKEAQALIPITQAQIESEEHEFGLPKTPAEFLEMVLEDIKK